MVGLGNEWGGRDFNQLLRFSLKWEIPLITNDQAQIVQEANSCVLKEIELQLPLSKPKLSFLASIELEV